MESDFFHNYLWHHCLKLQSERLKDRQSALESIKKVLNLKLITQTLQNSQVDLILQTFTGWVESESRAIKKSLGNSNPFVRLEQALKELKWLLFLVDSAYPKLNLINVLECILDVVIPIISNLTFPTFSDINPILSVLISKSFYLKGLVSRGYWDKLIGILVKRLFSHKAQLDQLEPMRFSTSLNPAEIHDLVKTSLYLSVSIPDKHPNWSRNFSKLILIFLSYLSWLIEIEYRSEPIYFHGLVASINSLLLDAFERNVQLADLVYKKLAEFIFSFTCTKNHLTFSKIIQFASINPSSINLSGAVEVLKGSLDDELFKPRYFSFSDINPVEFFCSAKKFLQHNYSNIPEPLLVKFLFLNLCCKLNLLPFKDKDSIINFPHLLFTILNSKEFESEALPDYTNNHSSHEKLRDKQSWILLLELASGHGRLNILEEASRLDNCDLFFLTLSLELSSKSCNMYKLDTFFEALLNQRKILTFSLAFFTASIKYFYIRFYNLWWSKTAKKSFSLYIQLIADCMNRSENKDVLVQNKETLALFFISIFIPFIDKSFLMNLDCDLLPNLTISLKSEELKLFLVRLSRIAEFLNFEQDYLERARSSFKTKSQFSLRSDLRREDLKFYLETVVKNFPFTDCSLIIPSESQQTVAFSKAPNKKLAVFDDLIRKFIKLISSIIDQNFSIKLDLSCELDFFTDGHNLNHSSACIFFIVSLVFGNLFPLKISIQTLLAMSIPLIERANASAFTHYQQEICNDEFLEPDVKNLGEVAYNYPEFQKSGLIECPEGFEVFGLFFASSLNMYHHYLKKSVSENESDIIHDWKMFLRSKVDTCVKFGFEVGTVISYYSLIAHDQLDLDLDIFDSIVPLRLSSFSIYLRKLSLESKINPSSLSPPKLEILWKNLQFFSILPNTDWMDSFLKDDQSLFILLGNISSSLCQLESLNLGLGFDDGSGGGGDVSFESVLARVIIANATKNRQAIPGLLLTLNRIAPVTSSFLIQKFQHYTKNFSDTILNDLFLLWLDQDYPLHSFPFQLFPNCHEFQDIFYKDGIFITFLEKFNNAISLTKLISPELITLVMKKNLHCILARTIFKRCSREIEYRDPNLSLLTTFLPDLDLTGSGHTEHLKRHIFQVIVELILQVANATGAFNILEKSLVELIQSVNVRRISDLFNPFFMTQIIPTVIAKNCQLITPFFQKFSFLLDQQPVIAFTSYQLLLCLLKDSSLYGVFCDFFTMINDLRPQLYLNLSKDLILSLVIKAGSPHIVRNSNHLIRLMDRIRQLDKNWFDTFGFLVNLFLDKAKAPNTSTLRFEPFIRWFQTWGIEKLNRLKICSGPDFCSVLNTFDPGYPIDSPIRQEYELSSLPQIVSSGLFCCIFQEGKSVEENSRLFHYILNIKVRGNQIFNLEDLIADESQRALCLIFKDESKYGLLPPLEFTLPLIEISENELWSEKDAYLWWKNVGLGILIVLCREMNSLDLQTKLLKIAAKLLAGDPKIDFISRLFPFLISKILKLGGGSKSPPLLSLLKQKFSQVLSSHDRPIHRKFLVHGLINLMVRIDLGPCFVSKVYNDKLVDSKLLRELGDACLKEGYFSESLYFYQLALEDRGPTQDLPLDQIRLVFSEIDHGSDYFRIVSHWMESQELKLDSIFSKSYSESVDYGVIEASLWLKKEWIVQEDFRLEGDLSLVEFQDSSILTSWLFSSISNSKFDNISTLLTDLSPTTKYDEIAVKILSRLGTSVQADILQDIFSFVDSIKASIDGLHYGFKFAKVIEMSNKSYSSFLKFLQYDVGSEFLWNRGDFNEAIETSIDGLKVFNPLVEGLSPFMKEQYALLMCRVGDWCAQSKYERPSLILSNYLDKAITLCNETKTFSPKSLGRIYITLARFVDNQYEEIAHSEDLIARGELLRQTRTEIDAAKSLLASPETTREVRPKIERSLAELSAQYEIDQSEYSRRLKDRNSFLIKAVKNYIAALCLGANASFEKEQVAAVFRLCSLWFEHSEQPLINDVINTSLNSTGNSLNLSLFLPLIYQLAARASFTDTKQLSQFQQVLIRLLVQLTCAFPFHCVYQLLSLRSCVISSKPPPPLPPLCPKSTKRKLIDVGGQDDSTTIKRDRKDESKCRAAAAAFIIEQSKKNFKFREIISAVESLCAAYIELAEFPVASGLVQVETQERVTIDSRMMIKKFMYPLNSDSLLRLIPIPTISMNESVMFSGFRDGFKLVGGINLPKMISCMGDNGCEYLQLVKGKDDVRQDAVMEQVFLRVNQLLNSSMTTMERKLSLRTYRVIPLQPLIGLLEWVPDSIPFGSYLIPAHERLYPSDLTMRDCRQKMREECERVGSTVSSKLRVFCNEILPQYRPVMRHFFYEHFKLGRDWWEAKNNFIHSMAAASIVGWIVGLGDRHGQNILLDMKSGQIIHIDLNMIFEAGKTLRVPEKVPFRLTQDCVDAMGPSEIGLDGPFKQDCIETLKVLRREKSILLMIMEVFKYDPLHKWNSLGAGIVRAAAKLENDSSNLDTIRGGAIHASKEADRALLRIREKLEGREEGSLLSESGHVNFLIHTARDPELLCQMYHGWQAWM